MCQSNLIVVFLSVDNELFTPAETWARPRTIGDARSVAVLVEFLPMNFQERDGTDKSRIVMDLRNHNGVMKWIMMIDDDDSKVEEIRVETVKTCPWDCLWVNAVDQYLQLNNYEIKKYLCQKST